ncbi:hypothetical protein B9Z19DRAFT_1121628 [Tuber borchii]|uniref:Uncharacterized protein n=1 Tax=Tuber borchii TaxID=42251 RepID=A0A2T7A293_TUBBO|nr:hypothetical protein B9Z19DRAFT_1121628 [Tuber borchii]
MADLNPLSNANPVEVYTNPITSSEVPNSSPTIPTPSGQPTVGESKAGLEPPAWHNIDELFLWDISFDKWKNSKSSVEVQEPPIVVNPLSETDNVEVYTTQIIGSEVPNSSPTTPTQSEQPLLSETMTWEEAMAWVESSLALPASDDDFFRFVPDQPEGDNNHKLSVEVQEPPMVVNPLSKTDPVEVYTTQIRGSEVPNSSPTTPAQSEQPAPSEIKTWMGVLTQETINEHSPSSDILSYPPMWDPHILSVKAREPLVAATDRAGIDAQVSQQPEGERHISCPEEHWFFIFIFSVIVLMATTTLLFKGKFWRKLRRCIICCLMALGGDDSV